MLLLLYVVSRYAVAPYLLVAENTRKINATVKDSIRLTKGFRWEITKFKLSYIGWALSLILLLPALYVVPYYNAALAQMVKNIISAGNVKIEPKTNIMEFDNRKD